MCFSVLAKKEWTQVIIDLMADYSKVLEQTRHNYRIIVQLRKRKYDLYMWLKSGVVKFILSRLLFECVF